MNRSGIHLAMAIIMIALIAAPVPSALSYEMTDIPAVGNVGYFSVNGRTYADIDNFFDMTYSEAVNYAQSMGLIVGTQDDADVLAQVFRAIPSWDAADNIFSIMGGPSSVMSVVFDADYWFKEEFVKIRYDSPKDSPDFGAYFQGYASSDPDISLYVDGLSFPAGMLKNDPATGLKIGLLAYRGEGQGETPETPTPEPSAILLLGAGIVGLVCFAKKFGR